MEAEKKHLIESFGKINDYSKLFPIFRTRHQQEFNGWQVKQIHDSYFSFRTDGVKDCVAEVHTLEEKDDLFKHCVTIYSFETSVIYRQCSYPTSWRWLLNLQKKMDVYIPE